MSASVCKKILSCYTILQLTQRQKQEKRKKTARIMEQQSFSLAALCITAHSNDIILLHVPFKISHSLVCCVIA